MQNLPNNWRHNDRTILRPPLGGLYFSQDWFPNTDDKGVSLNTNGSSGGGGCVDQGDISHIKW